MKRSLLCLWAALLILGSCKKDNGGPEHDGQPIDPIITEVGIPQGEPVSRAIGAAGGTLTSGDGRLSVTIPEGALSGTTTVSIQPISNHAPLGLGVGYRLLPEGVIFTKPVKLTFGYDDALLAGAGEDFLWVITQNADKSWSAVLRSTVDKGAKTVTAETTHFSDWVVGRFVDMTLAPGAGVVKVGQSINLAVTVFRRPEDVPDDDELVPLAPINAADEDELAPLTPIVPGEERLMSFRVKNWTLNGTNAPVSNTYGKLAPAKLTARYTAPDKRPQRAQVAVTAHLEARSSDNRVMMNFMLVSNLTIIDSEYFLRVVVDGVEYIYYQYGFNGSVPENPKSYAMVNCGVDSDGVLGVAASYLNGNALTNIFLAGFAGPAKGSRSMTCIYDDQHNGDDMSFAALGDGYDFRSRYVERHQNKNVCETEQRCPPLTVTFSEFTPGMYNIVAGSFSGTLYEEKAGAANACRSDTPHQISGEFRLAQAN